MSMRSKGLQRGLAILSLSFVGCGTEAPQPEMVPAAELRRQKDADALALEAARHQSEVATTELVASQRRAERAQTELDAAHATNEAQKAALDVAMEHLEKQTAAVAALTSQLATGSGSELDGAADLLRQKDREIRTLRDALAAAKARPAEGAPPAPLPSDGHVRPADMDLEVAVTTIDGEPITRREFCEYLFKDLGTPGLLDLFVNRALVTREARRRGVSVDDVAVAVWVESRLVEQIGQAGSEATFTQRLAEEGYTRESWTARLRYQARPQLLLERLVRLERQSPDGKEAFETRVREVYERDYSERVSARQIFVKCPLDAPPAEVEVCRQKAELALTEVQHGRPFAEVVARRSEDAPQTKRIGGSLGTFDRTRFRSEQELNSAFFTLPAGTPAGPIRSSLGFHVLLIDEKKPASRPLDAATRALIIQTIEREAPSDAEMLDVVNRIRARSHIVSCLTFD
jgi:parvulin-like peptidyl-prolyl isomerase